MNRELTPATEGHVQTTKKGWRKELREYLGALAVAFLVITFGFTTVGIAGGSMEPTLDGGSGALPQSLLVGDRVFVPKFQTWLRRLGVMGGYGRGEIVIVREPADSPVRVGRRDFVVKRVIGVPGDTVAGRGGMVFVNGQRLGQRFLEGVSLGRSSFRTVTLDREHYFLLGDNRTVSADSRLYGPVPFMSIAGRATAVIWPLWRRGHSNLRLLQPPAAFAALAP